MEDIMNIIIKVAATLLALGAGYLGKLLVGWLKSKLSDRDAAKLDLFISELCAAAEQMYRDADPDGTIRLNYVEGIRLNEGGYVDLAIENGAQGYQRNDLIVVRYTKNSSTGIEEANLVVIKGTAATSGAADPEYTSGNIITDHVLQNDMPLYRVPLDGLTVGNLVPLFTVLDTAIANMAKPDAVPTENSENPVMSGGVYAAIKSKQTTATIGTTWDGSSAPYTQTLSISGVKANSIVEISLPSSATAAQVTAFQKLNLQDGGQAAGSITIRAFGTKNTISIPVNVVVRSDS